MYRTPSVWEKINTFLLIVGTGVEYLFLLEEKRSKKVVGDYYRDCVPADAPGRNYKLSPALAIDSPRAVNAAAPPRRAPQRFLVWEKTNARFLTVGTGVPDCPNMVSVKASVVF